MNLRSKSEKIWFWCGFALLLLYLEFVVAGQNNYNGITNISFGVFTAIVAIPMCFMGVLLCSKAKLTGLERNITHKKAGLFSLIVFGITFVILLMWLWAFCPGLYYGDSLNQYEQAVTGSYNNWHPVLHTWLFFWFPLKVWDSMITIVLFQIFLFALAVTYLMFVLFSNGCPRNFMVLSWLYIVSNPNTARIMLHPWKDSAMTIGALILFTQLIQIYATNGNWLKKKRNLIFFSIITFLTMGMRHNAVLLVAPVFLILFVFHRPIRKNLIVCAASVLIATLILQGPIFTLTNVKAPDGRTRESVGMPMTILCTVYMNERDTLSADVQAFMDSLATPDEWQNNYVHGNFNSIKWYSSQGLYQKVDAAGIPRILKYAAEAISKQPESAWYAFVRLTHLIWGIDGKSNYGVDHYSEMQYYENQYLQDFFCCFHPAVNTTIFKYLFNYTGIIILFLLFLAVAKLGNQNLPRVMMVLAPMVYNFGTMLLLSGPDFRFFHFNFVIVVPLLYIILMEKKVSTK